MEVMIKKGFRLVKADQVELSDPAPNGIRRAAVFPYNDTQVGPPLTMALVSSPPGLDTGWHQHGPYEIMAYVVSGCSHIRWGSREEEQALFGPGDFFRIAPGTIHTEATQGDEPFVIVASRCGPSISIAEEGPEA